MITCMLTGILNRRSGLTYCNVTDTCYFYKITSSTQPTCIPVDVYNELKLLLRFFIPLSIYTCIYLFQATVQIFLNCGDINT